MLQRASECTLTKRKSVRSSIVDRLVERLAADPQYKGKRFVQVALGTIHKDQDPRDSLRDFTINKATISLFDIEHKCFLDYDSFPELTKDEILEEDRKGQEDLFALSYDAERLEKEQQVISVFGTTGLDFESRSPK